ncbi:hypothetical protein GOBAR_AA33221 [Gossypium barbadense]|uniref:Uncharacterized protein n=1 Tax=Gossypium barbadense TaxID=3634 RepID=A0A2P5W8Q1_GOSBA|nr:hypothetical protein GOBAR_AA33221 [Gossypium barbadense]
MSSSRGKKTDVPISKKRKGAASSSSPTMEIRHSFLQTIMTNFDDPRTVQFYLGGLVCQLSVPEFGIVLGLYTEEFMDENELNTLHRHIHYSLSKCWRDFVPASATYDPSYSKVSTLPPSLRYLHAILAHTLTGRRESTGVATIATTRYNILLVQDLWINEPLPPREPPIENDRTTPADLLH